MPTSFISYSREDDTHNKWVADFAKLLQYNDVQVDFDQSHLKFGAQIPDYMEKAILNNDFVLIICTPTYKSKSEKSFGGVAYEKNIINADVFAKGNHQKYIPILREGNEDNAIPYFLKGKYYCDLRGGKLKQDEFRKLIANIKNVPEQQITIKISIESRNSSINRKKFISVASIVTAFAILTALFGDNLLGRLWDVIRNTNSVESTSTPSISEDSSPAPISNESKNIPPEISSEVSVETSVDSSSSAISSDPNEYIFPFVYDENKFNNTAKVRIGEVPSDVDEDGTTLEFPLSFGPEYIADKVPKNEDIYGFIIDNIYYKNNGESYDLSEYNYYPKEDCNIILHSVQIGFTADKWTPDFNGATIKIRDENSNIYVTIGESYLNKSFCKFKCSTGTYVFEVQKNGIAYIYTTFIDYKTDVFVQIREDDYRYLNENE